MFIDSSETKEERSIELTCRICLTERDDYQPIFENDDHCIADWIQELTSLEIHQIPDAPASLCLECKTHLEAYESFRNTCIANDKLFKEIYLENTLPDDDTCDTVEDFRDELTELEDVGKALDSETITDDNDSEEKNAKASKQPQHKEESILKVEKIVDENNSVEQSVNEKISDGQTVKANCKETQKRSRKGTVLVEGALSDGSSKKLCTICDKFVTRLAQHQLIHKEIKLFQCEFCSKGFSQMSNLKKHIRTHTKEKPYLCDWCDKGFTNSTELKVHVRSHTQEKPFKCNQCDKCFVTSGHLVRHARSHSGEKPYSCDVCSVKFSTSSHLVRHKRLHSLEYPYSCPACEKRFMRTEYLKVHKCKS